MISIDKFQQLSTHSGETCVSFYIPTVVKGDYEKNRIRWKNAVQSAVKKLDSQKLSKEIVNLIDKYNDDNDFWANQSRGLATFIYDDKIEFIHLSDRPTEIVKVGPKLYTSPLVRELTYDQNVYVLALSLNKVRLFSASKYSIEEIDISDTVVLSQDEALRNIEEQQSLQHRSTSPGTASFHANSSPSDLSTTRVEQFLRRVDDGICEFITNQDKPLILAAVEDHYSSYKKVSSYKNLSEFIIKGNPDKKKGADLLDDLSQYMSLYDKNKIDSCIDMYESKHGQQMTLQDVENIHRMARHNNIDTVLIDSEYVDDLSSDQLTRLNDTLLSVFNNGGSIVYAEDMGSTPIKATMRYQMDLV